MNIEFIMLLILFLVIILTPQINIEKFSVFDHTLYYPDVDCLYTKQNSCIIKKSC